MHRVRDGIPASPGIAIGPARVIQLDSITAPRGSIAPEQVESEITRFRAACEWSKERIRELQERTAERMGPVEARIFEPQRLMLEDADLIDGTVQYIRENLLSAERAWEWRVLEWEARWSHTAHPMVLDRLNDLSDVQARVLRRLMDLPDPDLLDLEEGERVILVARDLTPTATVHLDPARVMAIATDAGTRTSHSAILARSLQIPCVVSLGKLSEQIQDGDQLILDGRSGRVIVSPTETELDVYRERDFVVREWEQELLLLAHLDAVTRDGRRVVLRANIDLPTEAPSARSHGAEGVGLFRTEFLVVGRTAVPSEEEQYQAYRHVAQVFGDAPVLIRTFDLGGDKFPSFLHMPPDENPFLGWRAIRVCLDEPELFRAQLRGILRAMEEGNIRILLPLINEAAEIEATRQIIAEASRELENRGIRVPASIPLGVMIETPAAAMTAAELARHVDFFSIGTNDLVQYTLAVDRGNARLAHLYNPFHPAVVRLLHQIIQAARGAGIEVSVCGELAGNPLGAFMLIGMGVDSLSVGPAALAEIKKLIRTMNSARAADAVGIALGADTAGEVVQALRGQLSAELDLTLFSDGWSLSPAE